jgi:hypothetical protein
LLTGGVLPFYRAISGQLHNILGKTSTVEWVHDYLFGLGKNGRFIKAHFKTQKGGSYSWENDAQLHT